MSGLVFKDHFNKLLNPTVLLLLSLFLASFFLRTYRLNNNLFFGPEQGIDFLKIKEIALDHNLTLIGPKTDIAGIFHGPLYYYTETIPFLISGGDPLFMAEFFALINASAVFLIYLLGKEAFSKRVGLLSSAVFTASFGVIVYSHWLSGHPLTIPLSALFLIFFNRFIKGSDKNLIPAGALLGLIGQAAFLNYFFIAFIVVVAVVLFYRRFYKMKRIILVISLLTALFFSLINYVVFDLTHNFLMSKNLILLFTNGSGLHNSSTTIIGTFQVFIGQFSSFTLPFFPIISVTLLLGFLILAKSLNKPFNYFLLLWIFVPFISLVLLRQGALEQFFVLICIPSILLLSALINYVWEKNLVSGIIIASFILIVNLYAWTINVPQNKNMFFQAPQPHLRYGDQQIIVQKALDISKGESYFFQSFTIPYWMQQGWEYLFWYYGTKADNTPTQNNPKHLYVILQQTPGNAETTRFEEDWLKNTVVNWGEREHMLSSGILSLEEIALNK